MSMRLFRLILAMTTTLVIVGEALAKAPPVYRNCTNLNKKYSHGIGRAKAHDYVIHVAALAAPVAFANGQASVNLGDGSPGVGQQFTCAFAPGM